MYYTTRTIIREHIASHYLRSRFCSVVVCPIFMNAVMSCVLPRYRPAVLSPFTAKQTASRFSALNTEPALVLHIINKYITSYLNKSDQISRIYRCTWMYIKPQSGCNIAEQKM